MSKKAKPLAIALMGPTAAGKTDLALQLCDRLPCEIISVDSALVYRGMDIGTAKPSPEILQRYPHRLVDILDPAEPYSAAQFRRDALAAMAEISERGRIPLLVGGTMLYFRALLEGLADLPGADPALRRRLEAEAAEHGWPALHRRLAAVDPDSAARLHPNHSQRILRALEVFELSGRPLSVWHAEQPRAALPWRVQQFAVAPARRQELHRRIALRLRQMLDEGFVEEVSALYRRGDLHPDLPAMRAVGYRQVWRHLAGETDRVAMETEILAATRQLAKRQLTWLRRWPELHWVDPPEVLELLQKIRSLRAAAGGIDRL